MRWSGPVRKPTALEWIGAAALSAVASSATGMVLVRGLGAPDDLGFAVMVGMFVAGVAGTRHWVRTRPAGDPTRVGLSTGEAVLTRFDEMELRMSEMEALHERVTDLEERLDFSERLLAQGGQRQGAERPVA